MKPQAIIPLFTLLIFGQMVFAMNNKSSAQITVRQAVEQIKHNVNCPWQEQTVDTFKAGNPDVPLTGIACTFMATIDVLYRAVAMNCNLIITHEPIYYNHLDETDHLSNDPVVAFKKKYIEEHGLVIWRFHDHIHMMNPDGIYQGMVDKLDWEIYQVKGENELFVLPEQTVGELADVLNKKFSNATIRIVGDPSLKVSQAGFAAGAPGYMAHVKLLQRNDVEVIIAGEVPEWESISYVRDAASAGFKKAMILIGHVNSEEAGMQYCQQWLKTFIKDVPVYFVPAGDSFSAP